MGYSLLWGSTSPTASVEQPHRALFNFSGSTRHTHKIAEIVHVVSLYTPLPTPKAAGPVLMQEPSSFLDQRWVGEGVGRPRIERPQ